MRIKLHFELENNTINKDYRALILSFIKNNLEKNFNESYKEMLYTQFILTHVEGELEMNKKIKYQKLVTKREKILDKIQQLKENEI